MLNGCKPILMVVLLSGVATSFSILSNAAAATQKSPQPGQRETTHKARAAKSVAYINKRYRFRFSLPGSWQGFSIIIGDWSENRYTWPVRAKFKGGPVISIRHPLYTEADPRQDIPIMVFTHAQWHLVQECKLIVSAAPIGPNEIGRNAKYVFATPARYNYALPTGWEEVADILQHDPLHPF